MFDRRSVADPDRRAVEWCERQPGDETEVCRIAFKPLSRRRSSRRKRRFDIDVEVLDLHAGSNADHVVQFEAKYRRDIDRFRIGVEMAEHADPGGIGGGTEYKRRVDTHSEVELVGERCREIACGNKFASADIAAAAGDSKHGESRTRAIDIKLRAWENARQIPLECYPVDDRHRCG